MCTMDNIAIGHEPHPSTDNVRLREYAEDVTVMRTLVQSAPSGDQSTLSAPDLARLNAAVAASVT